MKLIAKAEESHYAKWVTDIITAVAILKKRTSEEIIDLINTVGALKDPTKAIPIVFDMYLINNKPVFWQIACFVIHYCKICRYCYYHRNFFSSTV